MSETLFDSIFSTVSTSISIDRFLLSLAVSLMLGIFLAGIYTYRNRYTKSFLMTLALLPAAVSVVIMMVNGSIGAGVAVAGAFNLVRFRSAPGSAKEIVSIFVSMAAGLMTGIGYLGYAILFTLIMGAVMFLYQLCGFGSPHRRSMDKILHITIPEDLDYSGVFTDLMEQYTSSSELQNVKTTNMGSMFKLTYQVTLKDLTQEKAFIDALRCRNGNLEISLSNQEVTNYEL